MVFSLKVNPVYTGVPQGSILGPLMFILFFNDFKDCLTNANAIMYADDTVVYYADDDVHSIEQCLTAEFKSISQYLEKCELVINLKKGKTE